MKLIRQVILHYQKGSSDKVYEVDLCEVGANQYVVNFRYGRRGARLNEGTKTVAPEPLARAQRVFWQLVEEKQKKGYQITSGADAGEMAAALSSVPQPVQVAVSEPEAPAPTLDARSQAILNRLIAERDPSAQPAKPSKPASRWGAPRYPRKWPLERVIWRAGLIKLKEAIPHIRFFLNTNAPLRKYVAAWALGAIGDESAIPILQEFLQREDSPPAAKRIASFGLRNLLRGEDLARFIEEQLASLPPELAKPARQGPSEEVLKGLQSYLLSNDARRFSVLETLYLIDNENTRPALLEVLKSAPLRPPHFQRLRHIFKAAEMRRDGQVFGILAYRFEKEVSMYGSTGYYGVNVPGIGYFRREALQNKLKSPNSNVAYGEKTRDYLRRRVWRSLEALGKLEDADYVNMAVGVLLPFTDADTGTSSGGQQPGYNPVSLPFGKFWAFTHILFRHHPFYRKNPKKLHWYYDAYLARSRRRDKEAREEAFPKLWEKRPEGLVHLLVESQCLLVHEFAVKALKECKEVCQSFDKELLLLLLKKPYQVTVQFAFELAKPLFTTLEPDRELILAVASCASKEAREEACRWIESCRSYFASDLAFLAALATSPYDDTRLFARQFLRTSLRTAEENRTLIARLISSLLALKSGDGKLARDIGHTLLEVFGLELRSLGLDIVGDLFLSPLAEVQELGARLLLNHELRTSEGFLDIIPNLVSSPNEYLRDIGMQLLMQMPEERLFQCEELLLQLATHGKKEVRDPLRPVLQRLWLKKPSFGQKLARVVLLALRKPETEEGSHSALMRFFREDLKGMVEVSKEEVFALIGSESKVAQELGGYLLQERGAWASEIDMEEILMLADHEVRSIREASWVLCEELLPRLSDDPRQLPLATRLLDAKWDDSREFALKIFEKTFGPETLTPEVLVGICDSVREDVRALGQKLITRYFQEEHGPEYLARLSEHPSSDLQLFVTNYLERFAADNPEQLRRLSLYFVVVLSRVNKGRAAKKRVLEFLTKEALKSEEAARVVAEIFGRQSVTISIEDRAKMIEAMVQIRRTYPMIDLPLKILAPRAHHAV